VAVHSVAVLAAHISFKVALEYILLSPILRWAGGLIRALPASRRLRDFKRGKAEEKSQFNDHLDGYSAITSSIVNLPSRFVRYAFLS